jgi:hypothetical protein
MGCCGSGTQTVNNAKSQQGPPVVTGYALDMPDGRVVTYLTQGEAQAAHEAFGLTTAVREVLGWR